MGYFSIPWYFDLYETEEERQKREKNKIKLEAIKYLDDGLTIKDEVYFDSIVYEDEFSKFIRETNEMVNKTIPEKQRIRGKKGDYVMGEEFGKKKCCGGKKCDKEKLIPTDVHMVESKESQEQTKAELKIKAETSSKEEQNEKIEELLRKRSS
jgi:hypothetical protein